jgi:S-adenosylmethionine synthetase
MAVMTSLEQQSADIALGMDNSAEYKEDGADEADLIGAGDQGMMFGYACRETRELMPAPLALAHNLTLGLAQSRKSGALTWLRPDGKSQVTVAYDENGQAEWLPAVVVSTQHDPDISHKDLREAIIEEIIRPNLPKRLLRPETKFYVNPTGRFVVGGPVGDAGLTGRKIIVDTYGGAAAHGGGAFSGKDPTKVDRSAAYMARHVAKNLVAAGLCDKCQLQLAYAIGVARPVSVLVDSMGTGKVSDDRLAEIVNQVFDLRPASIIRYLDLRRPIYRQTASYGHFGRPDLNLPWEQINRVEELKAML